MKTYIKLLAIAILATAMFYSCAKVEPQAPKTVYEAPLDIESVINVEDYSATVITPIVEYHMISDGILAVRVLLNTTSPLGMNVNFDLYTSRGERIPCGCYVERNSEFSQYCYMNIPTEKMVTNTVITDAYFEKGASNPFLNKNDGTIYFLNF